MWCFLPQTLQGMLRFRPFPVRGSARSAVSGTGCGRLHPRTPASPHPCIPASSRPCIPALIISSSPHPFIPSSAHPHTAHPLIPASPHPCIPLPLHPCTDPPRIPASRQPRTAHPLILASPHPCISAPPHSRTPASRQRSSPYPRIPALPYPRIFASLPVARREGCNAAPTFQHQISPAPDFHAPGRCCWGCRSLFSPAHEGLQLPPAKASCPLFLICIILCIMFIVCARIIDVGSDPLECPLGLYTLYHARNRFQATFRSHSEAFWKFSPQVWGQAKRHFRRGSHEGFPESREERVGEEHPKPGVPLEGAAGHLGCPVAPLDRDGGFGRALRKRP